jgi:Tol biopolymer transport system component
MEIGGGAPEKAGRASGFRNDVSVKELEFLSNGPGQGELLADRLARGELAAEEALQCATDIGAALQLAHLHGVFHGSLSPHAIVLTNSGARVFEPLPGDVRGAAYRSPEQVAGAKPDWRSDIFAYGTILYEMASGRRAFAGSGTELDEAIAERPAAPLMAKSPVLAAMEGVIAGCLEKDPSRRRQRIQNAVIELKLAGRTLARMGKPAARKRNAQPVAAVRTPGVLSGPVRRLSPGGGRVVVQPLDAPPGAAKQMRNRLAAILIAAAFLVLAATAVVAGVTYLHPKPAPSYRFSVLSPEHTTYRMPSISPDGINLALSATGKEGKPVLWLRRLNAMSPAVIEGTEGGVAPFWSPDSQSIAFFADQSLKRIQIEGGPAQTICAAETVPGGGTWNRDGVILFAPGQGGAIYQVPASGGKPQAVLQLNAARVERAYLWPQFLPDGKHFLFFVLTDLDETTGVYTGELGSKEYIQVFRSASNAVYARVGGADPRNGYLLSMRDRSLIAHAFDASRLAMKGDAITLAEDVGAVESLSLTPVSASNNGILVYQSQGQPAWQMVWMDRQGRTLGAPSEAGRWGPPRISPDGTRAVAARQGLEKGNADLWILDRGGKATQFTDTPTMEGSPVWAPDGSRIAYVANPDGHYDLYTKTVNGGRVEPLFTSPYPKFPRDWSRDGKYLLMTTLSSGTHKDIWCLALNERRAAPVLDTVYGEDYATLSPDGKWMAYQSDETTRSEVYVQAFGGLTGGAARSWKISSSGGALARWRADGRELFYVTASGRMMAVTVHAQGGEFAFDQPTCLFQSRPIPGEWKYNLYDVSPDGQTFIMSVPAQSNALPLTVDTDWMTRLR